MDTPRYEIHKMPHSDLPFIFHQRFELNVQEKSPNWHENIELLQATEGEGYVLCGAEKLPLTSQTVVVVNADTLHYVGTDSHLVYRCLIIDNSFFNSNGVPIHTLYFNPLLNDNAVKKILATIAQAYAQYNQEDYCSVLSIRTLVLQLVYLLCWQYSAQRLDDPANEYVKAAMTHLRSHLSAPFSLDALAQAVGISKFHLSRQFKRFTGKTVVQVLNQMRCNEARRLIEGGISVSAAAASCGFENLSYFTRSYKRYFGVLPSAQKSK